MIDSIRRKLTRSDPEDLWATDLELEPEDSVAEIAGDKTVLLSRFPPHPTSNDADLRAYYRGLILTAIAQGGEYGGLQISIPWLRMTLAGLEMRPMPPEAMWEGMEELPSTPTADYARLFPSGDNPA